VRESERVGFVWRFVDVAEMSDGLDLTMPQIKTLSLLEARDRLCMCGIAILMNRTLSAMTSIVDRLVGKGLIARQSDTNDRRRVICALTNEGDLAMLQLWRIDKERLQLVAH
jgi:DNA-binding MarR family transcriptional regulator